MMRKSTFPRSSIFPYALLLQWVSTEAQARLSIQYSLKTQDRLGVWLY